MPDDVSALLGPKKQSPEEFLGPKELVEAQSMGGEYFDAYFQNKEAGRILDQFGQGFKDAWGTKPLGLDPDTEKKLKEGGVFNDYEKGQNSIVREFNEALIRPAALAADLALRGPYAVARGLAATETPLAIPGAAASSAMEAFPAGHFTGFPVVLPPRTVIDQAHDLGITNERFPGPTPNETARQSFAPTGEVSRTQQVIADQTPAKVAEEQGPPNDIHQVARQVNPEAFQEYDGLNTRKQGLENWLAARINEPESAESAAVRKELYTINQQIIDVAPDVQKAYKIAGNIMQKEDAEGVIVPREVIETADPDAPSKTPGRVATLEDVLGEPVSAEANIANLAQRRVSIAQDVAQSLREAGRSDEEARANGALVQAHYEARAARFNGELGTARDLYEKEAPDIKTGEVGARGRFTIGENTITLFKDADPSTFIHESAHSWMLEMQRDASDPRAPTNLIEDMNSVRTWLGAEEGKSLTRAQHEQFARGFERYMMEGTAPNAKLANVFAKFKDWLTKIYQTVSRLRSPINDEIRGVYDRLLSTPRDETIIAPEREVTANFADVHENDVRTATPENAEVRADQVRAERDQIAQVLTTEINNARRRARLAKQPRGQDEGGAGGTGVSEQGGAGGKPVTVGDEPAAQPTEVSPSGASFKAESAVPKEPSEPFSGASNRLIDRAGNIRLENLNAPDEVDEIIRGAARYNDNYAEGTRGVITDGQLIDLAEAMGVDPSFLDRKKIGDAFNAEEVLAARQLLVESATSVWNEMRTVAEGGDPLELAKAIAKHEMIQGKVSQASAEWGRAGRAFRALDEFSGDLEKLNQVLKDNTGRNIDQLMQLARYGSLMKNPAQVSSIVAKTSHPIQRGIVYYVTNNYISGPFTHGVYFIANNLRTAIMPASTLVQAAVGATREALGVGPADRVRFAEFGASIMGLTKGTQDALRPALDAFSVGQQLPLPGQKTYANPFGTYTPPWPKAVTDVVGFPGRVVAGIHQFSRVVFYSQYLHRLATREAINSGLEGDALAAQIQKTIANPPKEMMIEASDRADTDMFQRRGKFGNMVGAIERVMDDNLPIARVAFPFIKIGVEIERETFIKHTPLGLASKEVRDQLLMREGGTAFDEAMGKQIVGTGLMLGGVMAAAQGLVTGYGPTNPEKRKVWLLSHQPYSVTIGNVSIPMEGLGPPGKLMQFGADTWETSHFWDGKNGGDLAIAFTKAVERAVFDESFFRSAMSLGEAMNDPGAHAAQYLEGVMKGFVPYGVALGQVNRHLIDPYSKDIQPGAQGIFDSVRAGIPYASYGVPNRRDVFGEPIPARGVNADRYANDPLAKWLQSQQVGIGRLDRSIWGVRLNESQYDDLGRISGRLAKMMLDQALPALQGLPKGLAAKEVDRIVGTARSAARKQVALESLNSSNDLISKARDIKLQMLQ